METERLGLESSGNVWPGYLRFLDVHCGSQSRLDPDCSTHGGVLLPFPGLSIFGEAGFPIGAIGILRLDAFPGYLAGIWLRTSGMARRDSLWICLPGTRLLEKAPGRCDPRSRDYQCPAGILGRPESAVAILVRSAPLRLILLPLNGKDQLHFPEHSDQLGRTRFIDSQHPITGVSARHSPSRRKAQAQPCSLGKPRRQIDARTHFRSEA